MKSCDVVNYSIYLALYYCSISMIYSYEIRETQEYSNCSDQDSDWISLPVRFSFRSALVGYGDLSCVKVGRQQTRV